MSMIIGRKQIVLAALVVALAAAIYLNWRFSQNDGGFSLASLTSSGSSASIGDAAYVNNTVVSGQSKISSKASSGTASASSPSADNVISQAKLTRQQTRDQADEVLQKVAADSNATASQRNQAVSGINGLAANITNEGNIESLIKAKGFKDCVVFINNGYVNVVVRSKTANDINQSDIIQIKDIVMEQTNVSADNIRITQAG